MIYTYRTVQSRTKYLHFSENNQAMKRFSLTYITLLASDLQQYQQNGRIPLSPLVITLNSQGIAAATNCICFLFVLLDLFAPHFHNKFFFTALCISPSLLSDSFSIILNLFSELVALTSWWLKTQFSGLKAKNTFMEWEDVKIVFIFKSVRLI